MRESRGGSSRGDTIGLDDQKPDVIGLVPRRPGIGDARRAAEDRPDRMKEWKCHGLTGHHRAARSGHTHNMAPAFK